MGACSTTQPAVGEGLPLGPQAPQAQLAPGSGLSSVSVCVSRSHRLLQDAQGQGLTVAPTPCLGRLTDVGALLCSGFQAPEGRPGPVFPGLFVGLASPRKGGWGLEDTGQPAHLPSELHIPRAGRQGELGPRGVSKAFWQDAFLHGHWLSFCTCPGGDAERGS